MKQSGKSVKPRLCWTHQNMNNINSIANHVLADFSASYDRIRILPARLLVNVNFAGGRDDPFVIAVIIKRSALLSDLKIDFLDRNSETN